MLTEPDDMLNTGIEVEARPAGKKVKRLSLLSGGERSLVAVCFLVALFKARPSPFYILDEVEAALDDTNLGRLLEIYEELRENSQLLVITHQKRTMEVGDALYGVTMRGDGVSAVISQRLREAEPASGLSGRPPSPPTDPGRLRRVAHRHHALARRRRLRPPQQRDLLRALRHRGQRPPLRGDRASTSARCPQIGVVAETSCRYFRELGFPAPDRDGPGRRQGRHVERRLPDRALPGRRRTRPSAAEGRFVHVYVDNTDPARPVAPMPDAIRAAVEPLLRA